MIAEFVVVDAGVVLMVMMVVVVVLVVRARVDVVDRALVVVGVVIGVVLVDRTVVVVEVVVVARVVVVDRALVVVGALVGAKVVLVVLASSLSIGAAAAKVTIATRKMATSILFLLFSCMQSLDCFIRGDNIVFLLIPAGSTGASRC